MTGIKTTKAARLTAAGLFARMSPGCRALNSGALDAAPSAPATIAPRSTADGLRLVLVGYAPTGPNTKRGRHWSHSASLRQAAAFALSRAMTLAGHRADGMRAPDGSRWQLLIVRHGVRDLDGDNLVAAYKELQDAIVAAGLIPGDEWSRLRALHDQARAKDAGEVATVITLRMVPTGDPLTYPFPGK